jgi:hypothetical protein
MKLPRIDAIILYMSITMSQPPTNSRLMYSWGYVAIRPSTSAPRVTLGR